jgi:hypothetical protein
MVASVSMIRKKGNRLSEKIMLNQNAGAPIDSILKRSRTSVGAKTGNPGAWRRT